MVEIKISKEHNVFKFDYDVSSICERSNEVVSLGNGVRCEICDFFLDYEYSYILKSLAKAGLLRKDEKFICCSCWNIINNKETIDYVSYNETFKFYEISIKECNRLLIDREKINRISTKMGRLGKIFLKNILERM